MSLLRLSNKTMRELRHALDNTIVGNILPSEPRIRKEQSNLVSHLTSEKVETGKMTFKGIKMVSMW